MARLAPWMFAIGLVFVALGYFGIRFPRGHGMGPTTVDWGILLAISGLIAGLVARPHN